MTNPEPIAETRKPKTRREPRKETPQAPADREQLVDARDLMDNLRGQGISALKERALDSPTEPSATRVLVNRSAAPLPDGSYLDGVQIGEPSPGIVRVRVTYEVDVQEKYVQTAP